MKSPGVAFSSRNLSGTYWIANRRRWRSMRGRKKSSFMSIATREHWAKARACTVWRSVCRSERWSCWTPVVWHGGQLWHAGIEIRFVGEGGGAAYPGGEASAVRDDLCDVRRE